MRPAETLLRSQQRRTSVKIKTAAAPMWGPRPRERPGLRLSRSAPWTLPHGALGARGSCCELEFDSAAIGAAEPIGIFADVVHADRRPNHQRHCSEGLIGFDSTSAHGVPRDSRKQAGPVVQAELGILRDHLTGHLLHNRADGISPVAGAGSMETTLEGAGKTGNLFLTCVVVRTWTEPRGISRRLTELPAPFPKPAP